MSSIGEVVADYSTFEMCRACESTEHLVNLSSDSNRSLLKKLRACVDISIELHDALPNHLCFRCVDSLDAAYRFKIKCEYTDQKLRDLIAEAVFKQQPQPVAIEYLKITSETQMVKADEVSREIFFKELTQKQRAIGTNDVPKQPIEPINQIETLSLNNILKHDQENQLQQPNDEFIVDDVEYDVKSEHGNRTNVDPLLNEDHLLNEEHLLNVDHVLNEDHLSNEDLLKEDYSSNEDQLPNENHQLTEGHRPDTGDIEDHLSNDVFCKNSFKEPTTSLEPDEDGISIIYEYSESQDEPTFGNESQSELEYLEHEEGCDEIIEEMYFDEEEEEEEFAKTFESSTQSPTALDKDIAINQADTSSIRSKSSIAPITKSIKKTFDCETCHESFSKISELHEHKKIHGKQRFQCNICHKWFFKRYHLKNHQNIHRGLKLFDCTECSKSYTNQGNLDRHIRVLHKNQKEHVCDICGKRFSQSTILRQHRAVHMDERNFECHVCHKRYKTQEYLNLHMNRHLPAEMRPTRPSSKSKTPTKKKVCFCTYCGKKTNSLALHQSHMRTHTGEKPYECQVCHKKFSFQQSLRCHLLLHTGEKPYECSECGMTFRQIGHLKGHQLTHTGKKEHECSICFKSFAQRGNLTVHMRIHTGEMPYPCKYCPKRFYDSNGLKRHTEVHLRKSGQRTLENNEGHQQQPAEDMMELSQKMSEETGEEEEAETEEAGAEEEIEELDEEFSRSEIDAALDVDNNALMEMYISEDDLES